MQRPKMTNTAVERFQCRPGRTQDVLWDGEVKGFGMRLSAKTGTRTYFLQYRIRGAQQQRQIAIGRHNDPWRVDQARARAARLKDKMLGDGVTGVDPVEEARRRQEEKRQQAELDEANSATLREIMEDYLANHHTKHGPLRPATKIDIRNNIEKNLVDWLDKPVAGITRDRCLAKFTELSTPDDQGRVPTKANSTMIWLRALCNHAREKYGTDDGYPILAANPVSRMFKLRKPNPERVRKGRVPLDRVGHVWMTLRRRAAEARTVHDRTAADWISLIFCTGLRLTESGSLKWSQIDLEARTITLQADVSKNHNPLVLPLSETLCNILAARRTPPPEDEKVVRRRRRNIRAEEYVFASNGKKCPWMRDPRATMDAVSEAAGLHVAPHDLRRTAEDIAKAVKVDADERRQLLNHLASDTHGMSYSNDPNPETLRPAVEAIARFITDAAKLAEAQQTGANVVAFAGKPGVKI